MTTHKNYFEIEAANYFEAGVRKGELFGEFLRETLEDRKDDSSWADGVKKAQWYLGPSSQAFPPLIEELRGYAQAARVSFDDLWYLSLEDEVAEISEDKCTTIVTNHGALIAHNEDWEASARNSICVLRKTVGKLKMLELFYLNTLGGNAISINSHGFVHAINSLTHTDHQIGVPKNLVARWLSETKSPDEDFQKLSRMRRASGYHHTLVSFDGKIWSLECSATRQVMTQPRPPFIHTNHFLTNLSSFDDEDNSRGTETRYRAAKSHVHDPMSVEDVEGVVSDTSEGASESILNVRTIARMIIDVRHMTANIWLLREETKGWIPYTIDPPQKG